MLVLPLILTTVALIILNRDHRKDPGLHQTAKRVHSAIMVLIFLLFGGTPLALLRSLVRMGNTLEQIGSGFDVSEVILSTMLGFLYLGLSLAALILAFLMLRRNDRARRAFLFVLPPLGFFEVFQQLGFWADVLYEVYYNVAFIMAFSFLIVGGTTALIVVLYAGRPMKEFFRSTRTLGNPFVYDQPEVGLQDVEDE